MANLNIQIWDLLCNTVCCRQSIGACDLILPHVIKNKMTKYIFQALHLFVSAVIPPWS